MSRFVVLRHATPTDCERPLHWDFMLESQGVLRTWALTTEPASGHAIAAEKLNDHRRDYLDYEGPISGGRGRVTRWDQGDWQLVQESEVELIALLRGDKLAGNVTLRRSGDAAQRWWFFFVDESTTRGSSLESDSS